MGGDVPAQQRRDQAGAAGRTDAARRAAADAPGEMDAGRLLDQLVDAVVVADATGTVRLANPAAGRLFARDPAVLVGTPLSSLVPERFRSAHEAGFARYVATGRGRVAGGRTLSVAAERGDGGEVPVEITIGSLREAVADPGDAGEVLVVATLRDMTNRVELERQALLSRVLQASVDAAREGVLAVSPDRRVLAVNRRFTEVWHLPEDAVQVGDDSPATLAACLAQVVDVAAFEAGIAWGHANPTRTQTLDVPLRDGRVIEGYSAPIVDDAGTYFGRVWYLRDDTERRSAEQQQEALFAELAAAQRAQRFLLDTSMVLARVSGFRETLEALAQVAVPTLGDLCLIDVFDDRGRVTRMAAVHADATRKDLVEELWHRYPPDPLGAHPSVAATRHRTSMWSATMSEEFLRETTRDERHYQIVRELGFTSYMTVPLVADEQVLGSVTLVSAGSGRTFGETDLAIVEELAERVALVVAKERRYDVERRTSHTLQSSLLPTRLPTVPGVRFAVRYLPGTRDNEVGGDFWDVVTMPDGQVAVAVGDVAGHDITAAATMAQLRSACRALRAHTSGPDELVALLHQTWDQLGLDRMSTAVFARLRPQTRLLRVASAGHPPPLVVEKERAYLLDVQPGAPLGAPATVAPATTVSLPPGTCVVFYSDGLVEDRQRDIDVGTRKLVEAAAAASGDDPDVLADHLLAALLGEERADDVALLVVRLDDDG